jgi:hypothetical protein
MRQQSTVLRDVADFPSQRNRVQCQGIFAIDENATGVGNDQAIEAAEQSSLAGATFADECDALARPYGNGDLVKRSERSKALGDMICTEGGSQFSSQSTRVKSTRGAPSKIQPLCRSGKLQKWAVTIP